MKQRRQDGNAHQCPRRFGNCNALQGPKPSWANWHWHHSGNYVDRQRQFYGLFPHLPMFYNAGAVGIHGHHGIAENILLMHAFSGRLHKLADLLGARPDEIDNYVADLVRSSLLNDLHSKVRDIKGFENAVYDDIEKLRLFRTMLYVAVRCCKPAIFLETGVLNGFSSAFILQAMHDNAHGRLVSIDLPLHDMNLSDQGTYPLPVGKSPGWAIPDHLRARHDLRLGDAARLLPAYFLADASPNIFMHDSDHEYSHLIFELSLAWRHLKSGALIVVDNVELNSAYSDFARGVGANEVVIDTFNTPERVWQHGWLRKP